MAIRRVIYKTVTTSPATTPLINKGEAVSGNIDQILVSNFSDNAADARLDLILNDGSTDYYIIKNCMIPKGVTLIIDDNIHFDSSAFSLKAYSTGSDPALTIIIK